jgi:Holliday junction resolvase RusA-like endonuclease
MNKATMHIEPKSCPRPRVGKFGVHYPKTYTAWRDRAKPLLPIEEPPEELTVIFVFKRPKRLKTGPRVLHDKRPDIDNLIKALFDLFPFDDCRISRFCAEKWYAAHNEEPRIELTWSN